MHEVITYTKEDYLTWFRLRQKFVELYTDYIQMDRSSKFNDYKDLIEDFTWYMHKVGDKDYDISIEVSECIGGYYIDTEFWDKYRYYGIRCFTPLKRAVHLVSIDGKKSFISRTPNTDDLKMQIEPDFYAYKSGIDSWETFDNLESLILQIPEKC